VLTDGEIYRLVRGSDSVLEHFDFATRTSTELCGMSGSAIYRNVSPGQPTVLVAKSADRPSDPYLITKSLTEGFVDVGGIALFGECGLGAASSASMQRTRSRS
jgi:hypothetical protein